MEKSKQSEFSICHNDPLVRLFARYKIGPITLSAIFLTLAAIFTIWTWYGYPGLKGDPKYLTYAENISWFLSLIFIFPFVLGLTYKYYLDIPRATQAAYSKLDKKPSQAKFNTFWENAFTRIDHPGIVYLVIVLAAFANEAYFVSIYLDERVNSWMVMESVANNGDFHVTAAGWMAVVIQTLLTYWVMTFVIKGLLYIRYLHIFFAEFRRDINVNPLHEDGFSGLGDIARLATWQSTILLLLGIYVSLKVIDKSIMQHQFVLTDPGNLAVLISYVLLAPFMFFMLLGAAHNVMIDSKQKFLAAFNKENLQFQKVSLASEEIKNKKELMELILKEQECRERFDQKIHVWPFTWRSLQGFFGAVIVPLIPVMTTLVNWALDKLK